MRGGLRYFPFCALPIMPIITCTFPGTCEPPLYPLFIVRISFSLWKRFLFCYPSVGIAPNTTLFVVSLLFQFELWRCWRKLAKDEKHWKCCQKIELFCIKKPVSNVFLPHPVQILYLKRWAENRGDFRTWEVKNNIPGYFLRRNRAPVICKLCRWTKFWKGGSTKLYPISIEQENVK